MQGLFPHSFAHNFGRKGIPFLDLSLQKEPPGTYLVHNTLSFGMKLMNNITEEHQA